MRVTLAGFGGALAGLSFARRGRLAAAASAVSSAASSSITSGNSSRIVSGASLAGSTTPSTNNIGKKRLQRQLTPIVRTIPPSTKPYVDRELPVAWALACMTFSGVVEGTRIISPTSVVWELIYGESKADESSNYGDVKKSNFDEAIPFLKSMNENVLKSSMVAISDYMIGGAIAGAIFKGSAVRSSAGAKMDTSIMGMASSSGRAISGIFPGAALGLFAGVAIVAMDYAQVLVKERLGHGEEEEDDEHVYHEVEVEMQIPDDIKAMSNEELMISIENLKNSMSDTSRQKDDIELTSSDDHKEVRDLISMLGFRPHRS